MFSHAMSYSLSHHPAASTNVQSCNELFAISSLPADVKNHEDAPVPTERSGHATRHFGATRSQADIAAKFASCCDACCQDAAQGLDFKCFLSLPTAKAFSSGFARKASQLGK